MCFIRLPEVRFSAPNKATWWVHGHAMVGSLDLIDAANSTEIETTQWGPQSGNKITFYRTFTRLLPFYCLLVGHTLGFFSVLSFFLTLSSEIRVFGIDLVPLQFTYNSPFSSAFSNFTKFLIEQLHVLIVQHIRNFECTKQGTCEVFGFCYFHIGYFHNEHYRCRVIC